MKLLEWLFDNKQARAEYDSRPDIIIKCAEGSIVGHVPSINSKNAQSVIDELLGRT